jgi:small subunit ribosomal protein S6
LADNRLYEIVFIIKPNVVEEDATRLVDGFQTIIQDQGGKINKSELMGRRQLAYEINHMREGIYWMFEVEGSGKEIAELERRMRVNESVVRYLTVRMDEDRRRADKLKSRRTRRAGRKPYGKAAGGDRTQSAPSPRDEERRGQE